MEAFFIYLIKSSGIILMFLLCYRLFLCRETYHTANRYFLLSGLVAALMLPGITYTKTVWIDAPSLLDPITVSMGQAVADEVPKIDWTMILFLIYTAGVLFGIFRLLLQFLSLRKIFRNSHAVQNGKIKLLEADRPTRPFSFFNHIILHPESHSKDDIKAILAHEEVHVGQYHSVDILLIHFFQIFQWCNPFIYLYTSCIKENLEYMADEATLSNEVTKEKYQYLLLENSIDENHFSFVNPFFNSSIKKRIVMLNNKKSKKRSLLKLGIVLPLLFGFVFLFNVKTEAKIKQTTVGNVAFQDRHPKVHFVNKDVTDEGIEQLAAIIEKEGGELIINNLRRNGKGHIIAISLTYKSGEGGYVTGNYNKEYDIDSIYFGTNEKGGLFITTDEKSLSELKKGGIPEPAKDNNGDNHKFNEVNYDKEKSGDFQKTICTRPSVFNYKSNSGPLYLVNGVEAPSNILQTISPDNIESIKVLKSELAVQIYGEKGKNGVMIIQTNGVYPYLNNRIPTAPSLIGFGHNANSIQTLEPTVNDSSKVFSEMESGSKVIEKSSEKSPLAVSAGLTPKNSNKMSAPDLVAYQQRQNPNSTLQDLAKALIMVEGKEMPRKDFDKIPANQIESMSVLKGESAEKKYGKKGSNGVVEVTLKKGDIIVGGPNRSPLITIDGKESTEEAVKNLGQDQIKSINILKSEQALKKYGKKAKDGAVEISTKKD